MKISINGFALCVPSHAEEQCARMLASGVRFVVLYGVGTCEVYEVPEVARMRRMRFNILKLRMEQGYQVFTHEEGVWGVATDANSLHEFLEVPGLSARDKRANRAHAYRVRDNRQQEAENESLRLFKRIATPIGKRHKCRRPKRDAAGDHATHQGTFVADKHFRNTYTHVAYYRQVIGE